jgi:FAD/FMN-containing dehydrogenase
VPQQPTSWGRWPRHTQSVSALASRFDPLPDSPHSILPFGNGRSYGDVCLNKGGLLVQTRRLDRFIEFDPVSGILECESGVLLSEIIELVLPQGWFPPVTPGTALVTVGGAIANDVHGKNYHRAASFAHHVLQFELCRSDGSRINCSPAVNRQWFEATAGGLGLTGLITRARLQMRRVPGSWIRGSSQRFGSLDEFFVLSKQSDECFEYTVAWVDCLASGKALGRGVFIRGNHEPAEGRIVKHIPWRVPFTPPVSLVNGLSVSLLNQMYFRRGSAAQTDALWHYRPFLFPLDGILNWNRVYGPRGFFQYQCVLPERDAPAAIREMLRRISRSGVASFLSVLKSLGARPPLGLLSFARPGTTLALDFPNRGQRTLTMLETLDEITREAGGAVYPAKDARMSAASFLQYFPKWREFSEFIDPRFSSSFWRRVTGSGT